MLRPRRDQDEGLALVVALAVILVVFLLITAVLGQAVYDLSQSVSARRRLEAINAAEGGLAWYSQLLHNAGSAALVGPPWTQDGGAFTIASGAGAPSLASRDVGGMATFTLSVRYFSSDPCSGWSLNGVIVACTGGSPLTTLDEHLAAPVWAIVRATGSSGGVRRVMESAMQLTPKSGAGSDAGEGLSFGKVCLNSGARVTMNGTAYISSPCSGSAALDVGPAVDAAWCQSGHDLLAAGGVSANAATDGPATPCGKWFFAKTVWSEGDVMLSGGGSPSLCKRFKVTNSVRATGIASADPPACAGSLSPNSDPPSFTPHLPYPSIDKPSAWGAPWVATGWTGGTAVATSDMALGKDTAYTVSGCTQLEFSGTYVLTSNVAFVSKCGFKTTATTNFLPGGGGSTLYLITTEPACGASSATELARATTSAGVSLYLNTPCDVVFDGGPGGMSLSIDGMMGRTTFSTAVTLTYVSVDPPIGLTGYFLQDIYYVRELPPPAAATASASPSTPPP